MSALQARFILLDDKAMYWSLTLDSLDQLLIKADTSGLMEILTGCLGCALLITSLMAVHVHCRRILA